MELLIFGGLTACLIFFLVMACVHCIGIEKDILEIAALVENRVTKLYKGEI
jgi:hypothetical protein